MANRSYLYSIDFDRTKGERKAGQKIFGLSQCNYGIPLSYKILVSQEAKICQTINSENWDCEELVAIQGDFDKGKQKLLDFLEKLQNENIFDNHKLIKLTAETNQFLDKHKLENIILELLEIFDMNDFELEYQTKDFYEKAILVIDSHIEEGISYFKNLKASLEEINKEIAELSKSKTFISKLFSNADNSSKIKELEDKANDINEQMWYELGISDWDNILSYHFEN